MTIIDQTAYSFELAAVPQRIVSLVPSQTELLYDLGLSEQVVGITKFCIHPEQWFKSKTRIGGTKKLHFDRIHALQPDLIVANKEENNKEDIEALRERYPVYTSNISNLVECLQMIEQVGSMLNRSTKALEICNQIDSNFKSLQAISKTSCLYLIWNDPMMCAGTDTFINDILSKSGFINIINKTRYPAITAEELKALQPELLLLSSEPFPFAQKHIDAFQQLLPNSTIVLCDGEMFSWYGSRLLHSATYISQLKKELHLNSI